MRMLHTKKRKPLDTRTFSGLSLQADVPEDDLDLPPLERRHFTGLVKNMVQDFEHQLIEAKRPKAKRVKSQDLLALRNTDTAEDVRLGRLKNPGADPSNIWNEVGTVEIATAAPPAAAASASAPAPAPAPTAPHSKSSSMANLASSLSQTLRPSSSTSSLTLNPNSSTLSLTSIAPAAVETRSVVVAGTLNQLILHLTAPHEADGLVGAEFFQTFMVTLQTFTDPAVFISKMMERFECPPRPLQMPAEYYLRNLKQPVQMRVCNVLKKWVQMRFDQDLATHPELIERVLAFFDRIALDNEFYASNLKQCLQEHVS